MKMSRPKARMLRKQSKCYRSLRMELEDSKTGIAGTREEGSSHDLQSLACQNQEAIPLYVYIAITEI